jgi:N-methylhydantoinase A
MTTTGGYRIGIDVGGTFPDFVLADPVTGRLINFKEPSTPADPSLAVETGLLDLPTPLRDPERRRLFAEGLRSFLERSR